jgi:hypothetical protein
MELTGTKISEHNSSFVEFELDEIDSDKKDELYEGRHSAETIWVGTKDQGGKFEKGSILLFIDELEDCDKEILSEVFNEDSMEIINDVIEDFGQIRY